MLNSIAIVYWFVRMFIAFSMVLGHFYDNNMDTMVWCCRYGVVLYCNSTDFEFTDYGMLHTSHTPTPSADCFARRIN